MCQHCSGKHVKIAINYPLVETLHNWAHSLWDPDRTPLVHVAMSLCLWTLVVALYGEPFDNIGNIRWYLS